MTKPKTAADVDTMFVKVACDRCGPGFHYAGFVPGVVTCHVCDPKPNGRPRGHYHRRPHPRRRIRHIIQGKWTP